MNKKYLQALTPVGPNQNNPLLDPLAVLHLDSRLYRIPKTKLLKTKKFHKDFKSQVFKNQNRGWPCLGLYVG